MGHRHQLPERDIVTNCIRWVHKHTQGQTSHETHVDITCARPPSKPMSKFIASHRARNTNLEPNPFLGPNSQVLTLQAVLQKRLPM